MIAKLLIHPTLEYRLQAIDDALKDSQLKKDHPDVLWIREDEKLGVEAAKKIRQHLSLKPYSAPGRAVVVVGVQDMTLDAQNSLLKTLEEPPVEAIILLGADSQRNILPTVLSRVRTVILGSDLSSVALAKEEATPESSADAGQASMTGQAPSVTPSRNDEIEKLISASTQQRFEYIEKLEDKEAFFHDLLNFFHEKLQSEAKYLGFSKDLLHAEAWKQANGNMRAILEYLMLKMP